MEDKMVAITHHVYCPGIRAELEKKQADCIFCCKVDNEGRDLIEKVYDIDGNDLAQNKFDATISPEWSLTGHTEKARRRKTSSKSCENEKAKFNTTPGTRR